MIIKPPPVHIFKSLGLKPTELQQLQFWMTNLYTAVEEIRKQPWLEHTGDFNVTHNDFGKVHLMNIGSSDATAYLPSVDETNIYQWIRFVRVGTGKLTIYAADSDMIEYSSAPGRIWCDEMKRTAANQGLILVEADKWALLGGIGIWKTA